MMYRNQPERKNLQDTIDRVMGKGIVLDENLRSAAIGIDLSGSHAHLIAELDEHSSALKGTEHD